ncbi:hypothetical protein ABB07_23590 [Streptomyces incarnatus]|uniref:DUF397 domain-containing protein n=1 Tax=Streptomyces incarnatus TaxID=665007 RepID=A0ABM5TPM9_9ACTN|nr:DUF397 domain-containing protein [Streptomyces incarnatus]AKJ12907.1 hypothetical protein ABB07_23590 [Streptomyces incarnatus]
MSRDLYSLSTDGAEFQQFCGGNLQGEHESCVRFAKIPGAESAYVLTDSKPEGAGKEVRYSETELDTFVVGYAKNRGLSL